MTSKAALFALLAMWGVGTSTLPVRAEDQLPSAGTESEAEECDRPECRFVNRVWSRASTATQPELMRIFLADGTLVSDSSWGPHQVAHWQQIGENKIRWDEEGSPILAEILKVSSSEMLMRVTRKAGTEDELYYSA